jgi:tetratricopeptide (TPR) repeat protein
MQLTCTIRAKLTLVGVLILASTCTASSAQTQAPPAFQSLVDQANAARDAEQFDKAVVLYRKALSQRPGWTEGWWSLGTIYYDQDQFAPAEKAFQKVVALDPRQGTARAMMGLSEFELGQDADALRDIEASKDLGIIEDPQLRQVVLYHEGILLQRTGRFEGAQKTLSSLCLSGVKSDELTGTFGLVVLRMTDSKLPDAGTEAAEVVERLGQGACLAGQKNYDAARQVYAGIVESHPNFPLVHYAYGRFLLDARDRAGAISEFQKEIAGKPSSVLARLQIAAAQYRVDSAAGLPYAEEAVRLAPQMPFAHYLFGLLLLDTGQYKQAIPELEIARKAFPNESKVYWSLGVAYGHTGRAQDAAEARTTFSHLNHASAQSGNGGPGQASETVPQLAITEGLAARPKQ